MSFGKALSYGLLVTLLASVIYSVSWMIYSETMAPDFMEKMGAMYIEQAQESGASEAEIAAIQEQMTTWSEYYKNPFIKFGMTMMEPLPLGIILSLIASLIFRKKGLAEDL